MNFFDLNKIWSKLIHLKWFSGLTWDKLTDKIDQEFMREVEHFLNTINVKVTNKQNKKIAHCLFGVSYILAMVRFHVTLPVVVVALRIGF